MAGPLINVTVSGASARTGLVLVPPNPFDATAWVWQVARFAPTMPVVVVELPGYGRGTCAVVRSLTELADDVWAEVKACGDCDDYVLVGSSIGGAVVERMYRSRPSLVAGLMLVGVGWQKPRVFISERIRGYERHGAAYRLEYALDVLSPSCARSTYGRGLADLLAKRNPAPDISSIITLLESLREPDPEWLRDGVSVPCIVVGGSQDPGIDYSRKLAVDILRCPIRIIDGAGHACHSDQPWLFNDVLEQFLLDSYNEKLSSV